MRTGFDPQRAGLVVAFGLATFLGSGLFMAMQPLVGRVLLPQHGGAPSVWVTCLSFFQLALCAGYGWAHVVTRALPLRAQVVVQLTLLLGVVGLGPLTLPTLVAADALGSPSWLLFGFLCTHVALGALALAITAPLLQSWFVAVSGRDPYPLYAVSNAGSMLGLLAYPLWIEPNLTLHAQQHAWTQAFVVYAAVVVGLSVLVWQRRSAMPQAPRARVVDGPRALAPARPSLAQALAWVSLSAAPSALLAAISDHVMLDVPSTPLLWTAPLALYLGSFILTFSRPHAPRAELYAGLWIACTVALPVLLLPGNEAHVSVVLGVPLLTLWGGSVLCHGKLAELRPAADQLTLYYALMAAGGALGGGFVALVAPALFVDQYELLLSVLAIHALQLRFSRRALRTTSPTGAQRLSWLGFGLALPVLLATLWVQAAGQGRPGRALERTRSFFGALQVRDTGAVRVLTHGRTDHGRALRDPARAGEPIGYVGPDSGVGRALRMHASHRPRRLAVVGLGVGALAAHARAGDSLRFYEINPAVEPLARRWFVYLAQTRAQLTLVPEDARLALSREAPQVFDVLVLDAFCSDAIPVHLLTVEAFAVYLRQLAPDGLLLANVANRHLSVASVVAESARAHGLAYTVLETPGDAGRGLTPARWAVIARRRELLVPLLGAPARELPVRKGKRWTDEHASLLSIVE